MDRYAPRPSSRPTPVTEQPVAERVVAEGPRNSHRREEERKKKKTLIGAIVAVLAVAFLAVGVWLMTQHAGIPSYIDKSKYQAVFLQNGEFYFGKVESMTPQEITLKKVFYLQKAATPNETETATEKTDLEIVRIVDTVHAPEDMMMIERSQVLYVENLNPDSQVVKLMNQKLNQ